VPALYEVHRSIWNPRVEEQFAQLRDVLRRGPSAVVLFRVTGGILPLPEGIERRLGLEPSRTCAPVWIHRTAP
jgi:hypothetical protein